jgi:hypothetical protein
MGCATSSEQPSDQPSAADSQQEIQVVAPEPADDGLRLSQNGRASGVLPRAHFSRDFVLSSSEEEGEEADSGTGVIITGESSTRGRTSSLSSDRSFRSERASFEKLPDVPNNLFD